MPQHSANVNPPCGDVHMFTRLHNQLKSTDTRSTQVQVAAHSCLAAWLLVYREALHRPAFLAWASVQRLQVESLVVRGATLQARTLPEGSRTFTLQNATQWRDLGAPIRDIADVLDPQDTGLPWLPPPDDSQPVSLNLEQALTFYGYPLPHTRLQRNVVLDTLAHQTTFDRQASNDTHRALTLAFEAQHQDRQQIINALQQLLPDVDNRDEGFDWLTLYSTHLTLNSHSWLAQGMQKAADLLDELTTDPTFKALPHTQGLQANAYELDPLRRRLLGKTASGTPREMALEDLLVPTLTPTLLSLVAVAEQMNTWVRQARTFSLAQLLTCHEHPTPQTVEEALALISDLRRTPPVDVPLVSDQALSTLAAGVLSQQIADDTRRFNKLTQPDAPVSTDELPRPCSPRLGNYRHAFDVSDGLPYPQRTKILNVVRAFMPLPNQGLLAYLGGPLLQPNSWQYVQAHADHLLTRLLNTPSARRLGDQLLVALGWYGHQPGETTSAASRDWLVLAALILDLDLHAGLRRYEAAGFDLAASDHWGRSYSEIRTDLELHLIRTVGVPAECAPLAAQLLLAESAPEFLVNDVPDTLGFMNTHTWRVFKQGVMLLEANACGATRRWTFSEVMILGSATPPEQQDLYATVWLSALIDHAVAVGLLERRADVDYSTQQIQQAADTLDQQLSTLETAATAFNAAMPERRAMAVNDLSRLIADKSLLHAKSLRWVELGAFPGVLGVSGRRFDTSLVQLHMQGLLADLSPQWTAIDPRLNLTALRPQFRRLNDINTQFNQDFATWSQGIKSACTGFLHYQFSRLPLADRNRLHYGQLQLLVLRQPATTSAALESEELKTARTGQFGIVLQCTWHQQVFYYEVFPIRMEIHRRLDIRQPLLIDGQAVSVATGPITATHPQTTLQTGTDLPFDWQAYATGARPRPGQRAKQVLDRLWVSGASTPATVPLEQHSPRLTTLVQHIVQDHLMRGEAAMLAQARGSSGLEPEHQLAHKLRQLFKHMVPFWTCSEDIVSGRTRQVIEGAYGCLFDAMGVFFPIRGFVLKVSNILAKAVRQSLKLFAILRAGAVLLNQVFNPLEALPGAYRLVRQGTLLARRWLIDSAAFELFRLARRADITSGSVLRGDDLIHLLAILRKRRWHPFDPFSVRPYGPPLPTFVPKDAIRLTSFNTGDGYQALVAERQIDPPPLTLQRPHGADVLIPGAIYRYDPAAPNALNDLTSAAFYRATEDFDRLCPPGRNKRSPVPVICFSKKIDRLRGSIHQRRAQALFHLRIIPAPSIDGAKRTLVYHRQRHEVTPQGADFELTSTDQLHPVIYRPSTRGRFITDEPQFGLPGDTLDNLLSRETRVVELESIAESIDDRRAMRALLLEFPQAAGAPETRLVVEADTGIFYEAAPPAFAPQQTLDFYRLDFDEGGIAEQRIRAFEQQRKRYLDAAGGYVPNNPLVVLPTLEGLYRQLTRRGYTADRVADIRRKAATLKPIKQRELLLNVCEQGRRMDLHVVAAPIQMDIWPPRPAGLPSVAHINQYQAECAQRAVLAKVARTGIGPDNLAGVGGAEITRIGVAEPVVMWEYSQVNAPNYTEIILRTGAGNCDQMAHVAHRMIQFNGGDSQIWMIPKAHTLVVVGKPPVSVSLDFQEPGWEDLWVCDPWARVLCPARAYQRELRVAMIALGLQDYSVYYRKNNVPGWYKADDPHWLDLLRDSPKHPKP